MYKEVKQGQFWFHGSTFKLDDYICIFPSDINGLPFYRPEKKEKK